MVPYTLPFKKNDYICSLIHILAILLNKIFEAIALNLEWKTGNFL